MSNLFVYRALRLGHPVYKAEPELRDGPTTTDFRHAEVRPEDFGWPCGPEWAGFEPIGLLTVSTRGGDRQKKKRRLDAIRAARRKKQ